MTARPRVALAALAAFAAFGAASAGILVACSSGAAAPAQPASAADAAADGASAIDAGGEDAPHLLFDAAEAAPPKLGFCGFLTLDGSVPDASDFPRAPGEPDGGLPRSECADPRLCDGYVHSCDVADAGPPVTILCGCIGE